MTAVIGCVVLVIVAFLAFNLYQRYMPKNYEKAAKEQEQQEEADEEKEGEDQEGEGQEDNPGQEMEEEDEENQEEASAGTLSIVKNVNIRDNPATSGTNVIKVAQAGETYEYLEAVEGGEWYKIVLEEDGYSEGYVFADYVTVD